MPKRTRPTPAPERKVVYPEPKGYLAHGDKALTAAQFKRLLGWEEVEAPDEGCFPGLYTLFGKHVRLHNNTRNRRLYVGHVKELAYKILNRRWKLTGDTIAIGKTELIVSGQHRALALIWAAEQWKDSPQAYHWRELWPTEPTMETFMAYGVEEDDATFAAVNQGKVGTGADLLYRSDFLSAHPPAARRDLSRVLDYAVRLLWSRLGRAGCANPFAPYLDPAQLYDFLGRHPRLIEMAEYVYRLDRPDPSDGDTEATQAKGVGRAVSRWLTPGYATGLAYLMAASASDGNTYQHTEPPNERAINFERWDRTLEYWRLLAAGGEELQPVRKAIEAAARADTGAGASRAERIALLLKGWGAWLAGGGITKRDLRLRYEPILGADGAVVGQCLIDHADNRPVLPGIDCGERPDDDGGDSGESPEDAGESEEPDGEALTEESPAEERARRQQLEEEAAAKRAEHREKILARRRKRQAAAAENGEAAIAAETVSP